MLSLIKPFFKGKNVSWLQKMGRMRVRSSQRVGSRKRSPKKGDWSEEPVVNKDEYIKLSPVKKKKKHKKQKVEMTDSSLDSSFHADESESSDSTDYKVEKCKKKKKKMKKTKHKRNLCEISSDSDSDEQEEHHSKKRKKKMSSHLKPPPKSGLKSPRTLVAAGGTASPNTISLDWSQLSNLMQYMQ